MEQPTPTPNTAAPTWDAVAERARKWIKALSGSPIGGPGAIRGLELSLADMADRDKLGRERYGTPLQPNNGRDSLLDAYQELLDATAYAANHAIELGVQLEQTMAVYCVGPGGLPILFGCTVESSGPEHPLRPLQQMAAARFWKTLDLAVTYRMAIEERTQDAARTS